MSDDVKRYTHLASDVMVKASDHDRIVAQLRAELETERMRLVGCGVAALMNTEESKANRISRDNLYWSASYQDVCNMVDREIELRKELETARRVISKLTEQRNNALKAMTTFGESQRYRDVILETADAEIAAIEDGTK